MLSFVIGHVQIVKFRFELLSDMTVVPQQYTLHCVTIGDDNSYTITVYGNDQQIYSGGCGIGNCIKHLLHCAVTLHMIILLIIIIWVQRLSVADHSVNQLMVIKCINVMSYKVMLIVNRNRYLTVKGIKLFLT